MTQHMFRIFALTLAILVGLAAERAHACSDTKITLAQAD